MKSLKLYAKMAFACSVIFALTSCSKDHEAPAPRISGVAFVQASPDAPSVSFYIDQNQVNPQPFLYGSSSGGYLNAYSGNRNVYAYQYGSQQGTDKKITGSVTLESQKLYSIFLTGKWANAEFVLLEDSLAKPDAGKATLRFVNMSVGAPSLDLGLNDGTTVVSGRIYKQNSGFIPITGDKKYTFVIREHGATVAKITLPETTIAAGRVYTIWAKGIYTGTGATGPGAAIIANY
jgi:hypothetical protein